MRNGIPETIWRIFEQHGTLPGHECPVEAAGNAGGGVIKQSLLVPVMLHVYVSISLLIIISSSHIYICIYTKWNEYAYIITVCICGKSIESLKLYNEHIIKSK